METIKFNLSSGMAIIRKPDSNSIYYTYNIPHKIMLYGILGAIIGLNGYNYNQFQNYLKKANKTMPEFYEKLNRLKIAIVPNFGEKGFSKKIQSFNNSVGYASQEAGNNLIVSEQIIENPSWDIYILEDNSDEYLKIKDYLGNKKCEYIPYIGKNEHFANINDVEILNVEKKNNYDCINSIFNKNIGKIKPYDPVDAFFDLDNLEKEYEFYEILPTMLDEKLGYTNYEKFCFTNKKVEINNSDGLYTTGKKVIYYF